MNRLHNVRFASRDWWLVYFPRRFLALLGAMALGAVLIALLYQIPVQHTVDIGGYDTAYVQGFYDPQFADIAPVPAYLDGSDGSVRWTRAVSFLLFPQAGLPAEITLRLHGWRNGEPAPQVTVLLNGRAELGTFQATGDWEEHTFPINGDLLKASDIFIEIRSDTTQLPDDGRAVGVLLDQAVYRVAPSVGGLIAPYPSQVAYGALAASLLWLLTARRQSSDERQGWWRRYRLFWGLLALVGFLFLICYRQQPPLYPFPLRWLLPGIDLGLATLLLIRYGPALAARQSTQSILLRGLVPLGIVLWLGAVLLAAQNHLTLSVPGVEKDFSVFANRSASLKDVFQADGFYNLGYPLLLWLVRPLTGDNAFLAARWIAALSSVLCLLASYVLARALLPRGSSAVALGVLALSSFVVQYALYVGSDMPFAALVTLSLALLLRVPVIESAEARSGRSARPWLVIGLAGLAAGSAFLVRHIGLVLLVWGVIHCLVYRSRLEDSQAADHHFHWRSLPAWGRLLISRSLLLFSAGFLLAALPQLLINTVQTGNPLFNQQAKNVWLAVYGNIDWGRWDEAANSIRLGELILRDPGRFFGNWRNNLVGFVGSGAEDTSEFGRAIQLRLLGWPANWLAVIGLLGWLVAVVRTPTDETQRRSVTSTYARRQLYGSLLIFILLYTVVASMAFVLPRFFLPLAPIYAVAAAWTLWTVWKLTVNDQWSQMGVYPFRKLSSQAVRVSLVIGLFLLALLWGGFDTGARYVLTHQPADEVAILRLAQETLQPGETLVARVSARTPVAKYSVIAHRVAPWPAASSDQTALKQARAQGVDYLLWDETAGPPPLADPQAGQVGVAGSYGLYRLAPP
ncbi:MAG: glycosyltransferase family 39 protein [Chloroflexales bacterium]|nr:glycosyltransferase family 39 protein [Chloroflexales bacterium]